jgi:hypothetical protein
MLVCFSEVDLTVTACPVNVDVIEGKLEGMIEMTGRRGRRRKQLLDDLKEKRRYWKLEEEALDRTLWRTRFGKDYGPVVAISNIRNNTSDFHEPVPEHHSILSHLNLNTIYQHGSCTFEDRAVLMPLVTLCGTLK